MPNELRNTVTGFTTGCKSPNSESTGDDGRLTKKSWLSEPSIEACTWQPSSQQTALIGPVPPVVRTIRRVCALAGATSTLVINRAKMPRFRFIKGGSLYRLALCLLVGQRHHEPVIATDRQL